MSDQPKGPSWKNQGAASSRPANTSRKTWQPSSKPVAGASADPRSRFRKRLMAAGISGALLIALIVVVIYFWNPPKIPALVMIAPETSTTLSASPNVYGQNSMKEFTAWAAQGHDRPHVAAEPKEKAIRNAWKDVLGSKEKTIVLYFAAHGAADKSGPFLWMPASDATNITDSQKLPVTEILAALPADKQILLIFDATQITSSAPHGFLHNDFARALKSLDEEIAKNKKLVVISSSDDDQRSWVSEEWRQTIFGHFLNQGVRGGAGKEHPRVTAGVLFDYLKKEVSKWVRANRDSEQTPILLPSGRGKEIAEHLEIVGIDVASYQAPSASTSPGNTFSVPSDLKSAWEAAEKLAQRSPPPETAAPTTWRIYLDTLLRWEHLVRAGASTDAVQRQAEALERELQQGLFDTDPPCLANSLAVATAFGIAPLELDSARFREIWNPLKDKNPEEAWRDLINATRAREGERGVTLLRLQFARKVLEMISPKGIGATTENLERARKVLAIVDGSQPRPIETHLLLMLQRDLDAKLRPESALIWKALELRIEAERVAWLAGAKEGGYPYAEQVHRWVEKSIRAADRQRQLGEDLLLSVDKDSWDKARVYFNSAEEMYGRCATDAVIAADALRMRDRIFARLPYYGRWIGGYRGSFPDAKVDDVLKAIEEMAASAHVLQEKLEVVPENPLTRLAELKNLTIGLKSDLVKLFHEFDTDTAGLTGKVNPSSWHAIDNALSVPFIPVEQRVRLLSDLRSISAKLNDPKTEMPSLAAASAFDAKKAAQRQGRVALALLGGRWVEDQDARTLAPRGTKLLSYSEMRARLGGALPGAWSDSLREVSEQIGWHFREMIAAIVGDLDEANQIELKFVQKHLDRAGYLARLLDSATALPRDRSPASEERRYWTHEMLLWQAKRTAADGWASLTTGPTTKPYCEEAGERYVQAAEKLILGNNPAFETRERDRRLFKAKNTRALLKSPEFTLDWGDRNRSLFEAIEWSIAYIITPAQDLAVGYPVLRIDPLSGPLRLANPMMSTRLRIDDFADRKVAAVNHTRVVQFAFQKERTTSGSGEVCVDLLYRGHIFEMKTNVRLLDRPDIEWVYTPPTGKARFGIFGKKDLQQGAVAIIVDRTKSMRKPAKIKDSQGREIDGQEIKYHAANNALEDVLKKMPRGTMLNIGIFHGNSEGKLSLTWWYPNPIRWGETVVPPSDVIARVQKIEPDDKGDSTPLAEMLVKAIDNEKGETFPDKYVGFRSIVVLTDGDDNVTDNEERPATSAPGDLVLKALRKASNDIALNIILFGVNETERQRAVTQFKSITETRNFDDIGMTSGVIWSDVTNGKELVEKLRLSMLPKVQVVRGTERLPQELGIALFEEGSRRFSKPVDPGTYQLRALGLRSRKLLHLEPGDRLLLEMRRDGDRMDLRIPLYADILTYIPEYLRKDSADGKVHMTVTKKSLTDHGDHNDLKLVATLEKKVEDRVEELRMERPWFTWFEVSPLNADNGKKPLYLSIKNLSDRPVPTWTIEAGRWVAEAGKNNALDSPALPSVTAWWVDGFPGDPHRVTFAKLESLDIDFRKIEKEVTVGGTKVRIENIRVEGGALQVNTSYTLGSPIVVRVLGLKKDQQRLQLGETHHYFEKDGKYMAVFGPIDRADFVRQVTLEFYTLESLKKNGSRVQIDLGKPDKEGQSRDLLEKIKEVDE